MVGYARLRNVLTDSWLVTLFPLRALYNGGPNYLVASEAGLELHKWKRTSRRPWVKAYLDAMSVGCVGREFLGTNEASQRHCCLQLYPVATVVACEFTRGDELGGHAAFNMDDCKGQLTGRNWWTWNLC